MGIRWTPSFPSLCPSLAKFLLLLLLVVVVLLSLEFWWILDEVDTEILFHSGKLIERELGVCT
jgi:hypothetical protein